MWTEATRDIAAVVERAEVNKFNRLYIYNFAIVTFAFKEKNVVF